MFRKVRSSISVYLDQSNGEESLDDQFKNLYGDADLLEKRSMDSLKATKVPLTPSPKKRFDRNGKHRNNLM